MHFWASHNNDNHFMREDMGSILGRYIDYCIYGLSQRFPITKTRSNYNKIQ